MSIARSRITAQGQISVPARVRERLGVGPGSTLEWEVRDGEMVVRKQGKYSFADTRAALNLKPRQKPASLEELRQSIRDHVRRKHARR